MAKKSETRPKSIEEAVEGTEKVEPVDEKTPRSLTVAVEGIDTAKDFAKMMSALMSDLIEGRVTPSVGNATCNAGGKLLKVVEMQYKYGTKKGEADTDLRLTG